MTSETTTNSGSNKQQNQTDDDDEEEDEPVYIESSPCSRWQKRRETVCFSRIYLPMKYTFSLRLLNVIFPELMHRTSLWIPKKE